MPPPSNTSASTAIALTANGTTIQNVHDSGTTYTVYYKFSNTSAVDKVISVGTWGTLGGGGYRPDLVVWADEALTIFILDAFPNGSWTLPIPAGFTYWFEIVEFGGGNNSPAVLNLKFKIGPAEEADNGDIFIRSASIDSWMIDAGLTGLHGAFIDASESRIVGFIPQFITGEAGDILPTSGRMLFIDEYASLTGGVFPSGSSYDVYLFENDFVSQVATFEFQTTGTGLIRTHRESNKFYIASNQFNDFRFATVDADGALGTVVEVTDFGSAANAIAANNDESILYISHAPSSSGLIKRWDIGGAAFLSDLTSGLADHRITDLLVLADDSIIACYFKTTVTRDCFVRHYAPDGTLLDTYTFTYLATLTSVNPRLGYSNNIEPAFWLLNHLSTGYADARLVLVADGSELTASLTPDVQQSDDEQADPPVPYSSDSCPIIEMSALETVGIIGPLVWVHWPRTQVDNV